MVHGRRIGVHPCAHSLQSGGSCGAGQEVTYYSHQGCFVSASENYGFLRTHVTYLWLGAAGPFLAFGSPFLFLDGLRYLGP